MSKLTCKSRAGVYNQPEHRVGFRGVVLAEEKESFITWFGCIGTPQKFRTELNDQPGAFFDGVGSSELTEATATHA